ncbi:MAG: hypothetical protein ACK5M9_02390, partial [Mycobacterium sp.]
MRINALIAAMALALAAGAIAETPLAHAGAPAMNGVYRYTDEDGATGTWVISTTCTPGCVAHVT